MIQAGILGATGYAGAELVRLISGHPDAEAAAAGSLRHEGEPLDKIFPAYYEQCGLICENQNTVIEKSDVVFAALPSGLSQGIAKQCVDAGKVFIDMGADFRLERYGGRFEDRSLHEKAVYGLPELFREKIRGAKLIANPGCYATAVPLALAPALMAGLILPEGIIADCASGVTGAGRKPTQGTHFAELEGSMAPYKAGCHRHTPEMEQTLRAVCGKEVKITFVPHLLPVSRGILATCYAKLAPGADMREVRKAYEEACGGEFFLRLLPEGSVANLKNVRYSNFCDISLHEDQHSGTLIAVAAIDNMGKGAAGQAVQNMNLAFGLEETAGLTAMPPAF